MKISAITLLVAVVGLLAFFGEAVQANVGDQVVDGTIPAGTATVDGDLADWAGATWNSIDQFFTGDPTVLNPNWDAKWAARWSGDTIYVAVEVVDDTPLHSDAYDGFDGSDLIELYSYGSGAPNPANGDTVPASYGNTGAFYELAQHYFMGITDTSLDASGGDTAWATLGPPDFGSFEEALTLPNTPGDSLFVATSATGAVGGQHTLIYEAAMKIYSSFDYLDRTGPGSTLQTLTTNDTIGFAVAAVGSQGAGYAGTVSAGGEGGMSTRINRFGLYQLVPALGDFDDDSDVDGSDFLEWQRGNSITGPLDAGDLAAWEANFGSGGGGSLSAAVSTVAIPEPPTSLLMLLGLVFGCRWLQIGKVGSRRALGF